MKRFTFERFQKKKPEAVSILRTSKKLAARVSIMVAVWSKACLTSEIAGSNRADGTDVLLLCLLCVVHVAV